MGLLLWIVRMPCTNKQHPVRSTSMEPKGVEGRRRMPAWNPRRQIYASGAMSVQQQDDEVYFVDLDDIEGECGTSDMADISRLREVPMTAEFETSVLESSTLAPESGPDSAPGFQNLDHSPFAYRPDVDGLRAVAVIVVIIYHMEHEWLPGGFVGVDVFFVISGFVVSGSLLQKERRLATPGAFLTGFYSRRVRRLSPALFTTVFATSIALSILVPPDVDELTGFYVSGQLSLVGWANNYFVTFKNSYWDKGQETLEYNPFTHMWSLGVEEQFYFLFPAVCLLVYKNSSALLMLCNLSPFWWLAVLALISLALSSYLSATDQLFAFYLLPSRFWQLMMGSMLFDLQMNGHINSLHCGKFVVMGVELILVVCFAAALAYTQIEIAFPVPWSLLPIFFSLGYISLGSLRPQRWECGLPVPLLNAIGSWKPIVYIGRLSYPLYLCHWPVFVCCKWSIGLNSTWTRAFALQITLLLAVLLYHVIEPPVRKWRPRHLSYIFLAALAGLVSLEVLLFLLRGSLSGTMYSLVEPGTPRIHAEHPLPSPGSLMNAYFLLPASPPPLPLPLQLPPPRPSPPSLRPIVLPICFMEQCGDLRSCTLTQCSMCDHCPWVYDPSLSSPPPRPSLSLPPPLLPPLPPPRPLRLSYCACSNTFGQDGHTYHEPPDVDPQSTTPCFKAHSFRKPPKPEHWANRCFFLDSPATVSQLSSCLKPHRTAPSRRALFLVGDSHAGAIYPAFERALDGRMELLLAARPSTFFQDPSGFEDEVKATFVRRVLAQLQSNMGRGDLLAIVNFQGDMYTVSGTGQWLRESIIRDTIRANEASLLLVGDNPRIIPSPTICNLHHDLCIVTPNTRMIRVHDDQLIHAFVALNSKGDLHPFTQTELWTVPPDQAFWGNVPGTTTIAYQDDHHLLKEGVLYLWPYICSALSRWGFFEPVSR